MTDFNHILETYNQYKSTIQNEAQTKQYIIAPILSILEYNVNSPAQVISEFTADVAGKKGEKIDYAIKKEGKIIMLIECKHHTSSLERKDREQLERYFNCRREVDFARFAILTNGIMWKFYSDSIKAGVLDQEPFFTFSLTDSSTYNRMLDFSQSRFDIEKMCEHAKMRNIIESINQNFFERLFEFSKESHIDEARSIMDIVSRCNVDFGGRMTDNKIKESTVPFIAARDEFIKNYVISKVLKSDKKSSPEQVEEKPEVTENEYRMLDIVHSMLCEFSDIEKINIRNRSGLGNSSILFEDNQRKPILHMFFNDQFQINIPNSAERFTLEKLSDIYKYKKPISEVLLGYAGKSVE